MERVWIYSNNPDAAAAFADTIRWVDGDVTAVLTAVRDAVHTGARVVSHPQAGAVKLWETPYKSVAVLPVSGTVHFPSLQLIEDALAMLRRQPAGYKQPIYNEATRADFRVIDLDMMEGIRWQQCMTC